MCCISAPIKVVGSTKIFCAPNSDNTKQITIYENVVDNITKNNIMILPVPFPDSVEFHDLSEYPHFFKDCSKSFRATHTHSFTNKGSSLGTYEGTRSATLKVIDVGSYKVSLAMNLEDLNNLDEKYFTLTKEVYNFMKKNYNYGFMGFVVCKLVTGKKEYHPIAYSHNMYKKKLFIPTKHFHMHETFSLTNDFNKFDHFDHYASLTEKPDTLKSSIDSEYADDWHHDIYIYNGNIGKNKDLKYMIDDTIERKANGVYYKWTNDVTFDFDKVDFKLNKKCSEFNKFQIIGRHPNIDLITYVL